MPDTNHIIVDLGLLPSGHLHCFPSSPDGTTDKAINSANIGKAFSRSVGEGLFTLAARKNGADRAKVRKINAYEVFGRDSQNDEWQPTIQRIRRNLPYC